MRDCAVNPILREQLSESLNLCASGMNQVHLQWGSGISWLTGELPGPVFAAQEGHVMGHRQPVVMLGQLCCLLGAILLQRLPHSTQPRCHVKISQLKKCCHLPGTWRQTKATSSSGQGMSNSLKNEIKLWLSVYVFLDENDKAANILTTALVTLLTSRNTG